MPDATVSELVTNPSSSSACGRAGSADRAIPVSGPPQSGAAGAAIRRHPIVLAIATAWIVLPLIPLLVVAFRIHGTLTGADGTELFDQAQSLAWIRDAGRHVLASDLWQIHGTRHDYLHPLIVISGLLWRIGVPIQLAYLFWRPVALLVLFCGCAAYAARFLPSHGRSRAAALVMAIFYQTPAVALAFALTHLRGLPGYELIQAGEDSYVAGTLWGIDHTAITIGLTPIFLLAVERALRERVAIRERRTAIACAACGGLLAAWLYPWLAVTLVVIVGMLFVLRAPRRRYLRLAPVALAMLLPFIYSSMLGHIDPAWHAFDLRAAVGGFSSWWALTAEFGPLIVLAVLGRRRPRDDGEWMLVLWPVATLLVYVLLPEYHSHSLAGVVLPLSVLAVRGALVTGARGRLRRPAAITAAFLLIGLATVPAAAYHFVAATQYGTGDGARSRDLAVLGPDQSAAMRYLSQDQQPGGVMAPWMLSMSVPEFTGRTVVAGHPQWQPSRDIPLDQRFFSQTLRDPTGASRRRLLSSSGARFVIADCSVSPDVHAAIARITTLERHYGCVDVYRAP